MNIITHVIQKYGILWLESHTTTTKVYCTPSYRVSDIMSIGRYPYTKHRLLTNRIWTLYIESGEQKKHCGSFQKQTSSLSTTPDTAEAKPHTPHSDKDY